MSQSQRLSWLQPMNVKNVTESKNVINTTKEGHGTKEFNKNSIKKCEYKTKKITVKRNNLK